MQTRAFEYNWKTNPSIIVIIIVDYLILARFSHSIDNKGEGKLIVGRKLRIEARRFRRAHIIIPISETTLTLQLLSRI